MAAGKPVVASNIPGNNEAVVHEQTGLLVPPDRAEQLAGAIRSVLEEPDIARLMGECGRRRVETRFTRQRMATDVGAVYDELLVRDGRNA
jgi:glycosyltransferase involved in cell wall biosynthesis